jgi:molecular chaperone HtpG
VRLSTRLTASAACLVADANDMTPRMQRMLAQMGQAVPKTKPILEVNGDHPLIGKLRVVHLGDKDDPRIGWCAQVCSGRPTSPTPASCRPPTRTIGRWRS